MIKKGDILYVICDFLIDCGLEHKANESCLVTHKDEKSDYNKYNISVSFYPYSCNPLSEESYSEEEISEYFYNKAEWRDEQINSILND